jgi:hypothetical protein
MDGDRVLRPLARERGAVSLREHLSPTGRPPSGRCLWSRRGRQGAPLRLLPMESPSPTGRPPPIAGSGVTEPDGTGPPPVARASASTDVAATNASLARCAESWKSSIITRRCSCICCVGRVTSGAPVNCVPPISSVVPPNKSSN